ncbi:MAG: hypothetical protein QOG94_3004 [Solirubrobacteraceae bacterium]|jgi:hypothetical protein|nr:hypothetical protein [Solirubrobacteraceae bacterium]MEA2139864.1 hypothetical protein [Solirubrobacteraceae bacterium]
MKLLANLDPSVKPQIVFGSLDEKPTGFAEIDQQAFADFVKGMVDGESVERDVDRSAA